jgi:hypothetical protein
MLRRIKLDHIVGTYLSRPGPLYPRVPSSTGLTSSLAGAAAGVSSVVVVGSVAAGASVVAASVVSAAAGSAAGVSTGASGAATGSSTGFVASDMLMGIQRCVFERTKVCVDGMQMGQRLSPVMIRRMGWRGRKKIKMEVGGSFIAG